MISGRGALLRHSAVWPTCQPASDEDWVDFGSKGRLHCPASPFGRKCLHPPHRRKGGKSRDCDKHFSPCFVSFLTGESSALGLFYAVKRDAWRRISWSGGILLHLRKVQARRRVRVPTEGHLTVNRLMLGCFLRAIEMGGRQLPWHKASGQQCHR